MGEIAATKIIAGWKGDFVADACTAAIQIGLLQSGNMLGIDRAKTLLSLNFDMRKVDEIHWSTVWAAFQNGRATVISNIELRKRYLPTVANDNNRFQVTWFDDVDQSAAKEEILRGVLGAGEFS
jgi:hypothetical protein